MADGSDPATPPRARWVLWLVSGVLAGLMVGFVAGLARPRPRTL